MEIDSSLWDSIHRAAEQVKQWPAWMKGGPNYRVIEGEEIAMSKEVELPTLSRAAKRSMQLGSYQIAYWGRTDQLRVALAQIATLRDAFICTGRNIGAFLTDGVSTEFICNGLPEEARLVVERLTAQIATLTAQVEELTATIGRMRKANDAYVNALGAANAELAALQEGTKVYHLMREECDVDPDIFDVAGIEEFARVAKIWEPYGKKFQFVERIVITRERILDTEPCKHCGPGCIPGAAHNARAEDGVIWERPADKNGDA